MVGKFGQELHLGNLCHTCDVFALCCVLVLIIKKVIRFEPGVLILLKRLHVGIIMYCPVNPVTFVRHNVLVIWMR